MKSFLIAAAALLLLGGVASAKTTTHSATATSAASVAHEDGAQPFLRGAGDMNQVADLVHSSLAKNSSGTGPISDVFCKTKRSCITPLELFTEIRRTHPDVGVGNDVNALESYLRTLVRNDHPTAGKRSVGRVLVRGGVRTMDYAYSREPAPDEAVWVDVNTGEEILMGNCLNTIDLTTVNELVVEAGCAYDVVEVRAGDTAVNFALMGKYKNDQCFKYAYLGATAERADGVELDWLPLPTHCPERPCSFAGFEHAFQQPIMQSGGLAVKPGFYVFAVSLDFAKSVSNIAAYCLDHGPGVDRLVRHSCSIDIHKGDYRKGSLGNVQANIFYTREEGRKAQPEGRLLWWAMPDKTGNCPPD